MSRNVNDGRLLYWARGEFSRLVSGQASRLWYLRKNKIFKGLSHSCEKWSSFCVSHKAKDCGNFQLVSMYLGVDVVE